MGKDYKIGLVSGSVLAAIALIWVATRPSLSPEARMLRSSQAMPHGSGVGLADRESSRTGGDNSSAAPHAPLGSIIDSQSKDRGQTTEVTKSSSPQSPPASRNPQSTLPTPQPNEVPDLTIYEKAEKIKTTRFHIVRREETLSAISQQYYGTPSKWQKILQANKNIIKDPNKLQPGTKLTIPE
jgi:nucleoid-associated protein YgaU